MCPMVDGSEYDQAEVVVVMMDLGSPVAMVLRVPVAYTYLRYLPAVTVVAAVQVMGASRWIPLVIPDYQAVPIRDL